MHYMETSLSLVLRISSNYLRCIILLYLITVLHGSINAQNTFYYNSYKHWTPTLETLASHGNDAMAIVSLGSCYDRADGIDRNTDKAFELFKQAAKLGDFLALYNLGYYYFKGISTNPNNAEAEKNLLEAVRKNPKFMPAYQILAQIYDKGGYGVDIDYTKAFEMYSKASEYGDKIADFNIASYYKRGLIKGVPDYKKSLEYYLKAKDYWEAHIKPAGLVAHQIAEFYLYGFGMEPDLDKAIFYLKESVDLGFPDAYMNLATAFNKKGDLNNAFQSLLIGFEKGVKQVCNNLGDCYYYGRGTEKSFEKAYEMFMIGSETSPFCKYRQSEMLRKGEGTTQNVNQAMSLLRESADAGVGRAQYRLGCDLYEGSLIDRNYSEAIDLLKKALHDKYIIDEVKGDICRKLSICYRFGRGVEANEQQAEKYSQQAAEYGEPNAKLVQEWLSTY